MTQAAIPFAGSTIVALDPDHFEAIRRCVALCFRIAHSPQWQGRVDAGAPPHLLHVPGNFGVFMGYDFHLTPSGPRLIEINTNAGGALVNGLHTAALCDPERLACVCAELMPVADMEARLVAQFRDELAAARGPEAALRRVAIADLDPRAQFLYPEFELFRALFARAGIDARICDTRELARRARPAASPSATGPPTSCTCATPTSRSRRRARTRCATPISRAASSSHLRRASTTCWPTSAAWCCSRRRRSWRRSARHRTSESCSRRSCPRRGCWRSRMRTRCGACAATGSSSPATAFGSRAVYRGDKLSRRRFAELLLEPGYLVQRRVEPGELAVATSDGVRRMKFDVRAYAYRDQVLLLGARVYQGQVTNLRSPGGGFSAICVARGANSR